MRRHRDGSPPELRQRIGRPKEESPAAGNSGGPPRGNPGSSGFVKRGECRQGDQPRGGWQARGSQADRLVGPTLCRAASGLACAPEVKLTRGWTPWVGRRRTGEILEEEKPMRVVVPWSA